MDVCFEKITPYGGGTIMFWAETETRTELFFFKNGVLNARRYIRHSNTTCATNLNAQG